MHDCCALHTAAVWFMALANVVEPVTCKFMTPCKWVYSWCMQTGVVLCRQRQSLASVFEVNKSLSPSVVCHSVTLIGLVESQLLKCFSVYQDIHSESNSDTRSCLQQFGDRHYGTTKAPLCYAQELP